MHYKVRSIGYHLLERQLVKRLLEVYNFSSKNMCEKSPSLESDNIEHVWCYISELIKDGIKQFIPTVRVNRYNQPKWSNSSIRHNINRVRTRRHKYNKHPSEQNKLKLENNETLLQAEISNAKADYESTLISNFSYSNSKIYKYIRSLTSNSCIMYPSDLPDMYTQARGPLGPRASRGHVIQLICTM